MQVLFVGPLIPLFWTSGDVSSGFVAYYLINLFAFAPVSPSMTRSLRALTHTERRRARRRRRFKVNS